MTRSLEAIDSIVSSQQQPPAGFVHGGVRGMLRLEALAVFLLSTTAFANTHGNWWLYAALFFTPDLSFLAYLLNPRAGAVAYNALHTYAASLPLLAMGYFLHAETAVSIALIWTAHIGFDRAAGYGLKYATAFGDTHLGRLGRQGR